MNTTPLPHGVRNALESILAYLQDSERSHYETEPVTGRKQHIYRRVMIARQWLDEQEKPAPTLLDACKAARELAYTLGDLDTQESRDLFGIYMLCDEAITHAEAVS